MRCFALVVWLAAPGAPASTPQKVVLDQRNLAFIPHVLAVRVGTTVEFPNNDKVFHNVFSFRDGKTFDLGNDGRATRPWSATSCWVSIRWAATCSAPRILAVGACA